MSSASLLRDRVVAAALLRVRERLDGLGVRASADQLYYATCRALLPPVPAWTRPGFLLPRPVGRTRFEAVLASIGGPEPLPATAPLAAPSPDAPDLLDYGLPRLLVCQHDSVVAVLLANDLHMDAATPVLGPGPVAGGLPARLRDPLASAAGRIVLLHDATPTGTAWAAAATVRLAGTVAVSALGLTLAQARTLHLVRAAGGGAELAAVPPEHLLRVLRRLLTGSRRRRRRPGLRRRAGQGFLTWPEGAAA